MSSQMVESHSYPDAESTINYNIKRVDLIRYFANHSNAGVVKYTDLFLKQADAKGFRCEECLEINKLFSHVVDDQSVRIPNNLMPSLKVNPQVIKDRI